MNAERLLEHYERIAEAPDVITRLRRFILDLAVRGKLVPQDPNDEQASELLKRIAREKLDHAGLPQGWRRAKIGTILDFQYGKGLKASERLEQGPVPVFGSNGIVGFTDEPLTERPSIIVGRKGSAGALNLCDGPSWTTDVAYFVEPPPFLEIRFLVNALTALDLDKLGKGVKPGLSRSEAYEQVITIPPLAEQLRIVAKVDELMALCDRLEVARAAREAARDRLTAASFARLGAPDPETFQADARFALDALPALTARRDQIKQLRQTILALATMGKLVAQDEKEESAQGLLARIRARAKQTEVRSRESEPFAPSLDWQYPKTWAPARLAEVMRSSFYGPRFGADEYSREGVPTIRTTDMTSDGKISLRDAPRVAVSADRLEDFRCLPGDLLVTRTGSIGTMAVFRGDYLALPSAYLIRLRFWPDVSPEYVYLVLKSPRGQESLGLGTTRVAQPNINARALSEIAFALPPSAEQRRIVAKVDELMALCDRLEASLAAADDARASLLEALLHEALSAEEDVEEVLDAHSPQDLDRRAAAH